MTENPHESHSVPSDFAQLPIVWKYELLKYLRSRRLLAAFAIVAVILALLFSISPLLGNPYTGTDTQVAIDLIPIEYSGYEAPPGISSEWVSTIDRGTMDLDSLMIYLDGAAFPDNDGANWVAVKVAPKVDPGGNENNVVFIVQGVNASSSVTATYDWYTSAESFAVIFVSFANIMVIICATLFGADALVSEFQNRTGYLIFPNPVKRTTLLVGKFSASVTASMLLMTVFYGVVAVLSLYACRGIDDDFLLSYALMAEYAVAAMALAYLLSALLKGSTGALVLTFFLLLMILPIIDQVSMVAGTKIEGSLTFASNAMIYILYDPYPVDSMIDFHGGMSFYQFYPTPGTAAVVMFAYAAVCLALSMVLFKRKQLVG
ncbi:MAG: ABC transporter permease [Thermoplasmata archaeon]|nr:ABC transporter permease [Thermoplasmata archaeon]